MDDGDLAIRWTVRVAMALYVMSLVLSGLAGTRQSWLVAARLAWSLGCLAYLAHVACAFEYAHHWSHPDAYAATARQTEEIVGLKFGGGLYANYAFTLVWMLDVCWWWAGIERYRARPRWVAWTVYGFLGFIAVNATVVFPTGAIRWFGIGACVLLAAVWGRRLFAGRA